MSEPKHLAVEANKNSIRYAMEGNKGAWLALYTDDAIVADPVGVSPMDPTGEGHQGKAAIEQFWDTIIGPAELEIRVEKRWTTSLSALGSKAVIQVIPSKHSLSACQ